MDPDEPCQCTHERKWHNACSLCPCAYFLPLGASPGDLLIWQGRLDERAQAEAPREPDPPLPAGQAVMDEVPT